MSRLLLMLAIALASANVAPAQEKPKDELPALEAQIAETPDDPLLHYRRAQLLAKMEKYDDAYAAAETAMQKFIKADKELSWLMLESFSAGDYPVTVHFNMGEHERMPPDDGIARPLSFRVYDKAGKRIVETFDFERGYSEGKLITSAFGKTTAEGHENWGVIDSKSPYSKVRARAIDIIKQLKVEE